MLRRLFWNPHWNGVLYMVSLAERLIHSPSQHSIDEINRCLAADLPPSAPGTALQFRLIFVSREGEELTTDILYLSDLKSLNEMQE